MPLELHLDPGAAGRRSAPPALEIALVNNMPDAALEDTERQFAALLGAAAGSRAVRFTLHQLPGVPRGLATRAAMANRYLGLPELFARRYDGVIVTGTEPCQPDLQREPYWPALAAVFDWAARETRAAIYSCLAAHAAVWHHDGIPRHALAEKLCGIFASRPQVTHALLADVAPGFPHSRWNEVRAADLAACNYIVLAGSRRIGAGIFAREQGNCLALYLQGHPEYEATTLFKEYRRDVRRYLNGERQDYPAMPHGYFDPAARARLRAFERWATARRAPANPESFPALESSLARDWERAATQLYRNWLRSIERRARPRTVAVPATPTRRAAVAGYPR